MCIQETGQVMIGIVLCRLRLVAKGKHSDRLPKMVLAWRCLFVPLLLAGCDRRPQEAPTTTPAVAKIPAFPAEHLGAFYQGIAELEMDRHESAAAIYQGMVDRRVFEPAVLANLAIAKLSLQQPDDADRLSLRAFESAPAHPDIALVRAAVLGARGQDAESVALLRRITTEHPRHVAAHWALISRLESDASADKRELESLNGQLLRLRPTNLAALLSALRASAAAGESARTVELLDRILAVVANAPPGVAKQADLLRTAAQSKDATATLRAATAMRNLLRQTDRFRSDVLALGPSATDLPGMVRHPLGGVDGIQVSARSEIRFKQSDGLQHGGPDQSAVTIGTVAEDRSAAMYQYGLDRTGRLFSSEGGLLTDVTKKAGLADVPPARFAAFVDLNNDRRLDLLLCCEAGDRLYRQIVAGVFRDATTETGLASVGPSLGACPYDYDNDGDLDLLRWTSDELHILRNDGEGTLTEPPPPRGLPATLAGISAIQPWDIDDDGDVDLFITLGASPFGWRVLSNERLATFRDVSPEMKTLTAQFNAAPLIADLDHDGRWEILQPELEPVRSYAIGDDFEVNSLSGRHNADEFIRSAVCADFDCDGEQDLIKVRSDGTTSRGDVSLEPGGTLHAVDLNRDGYPDLVSSGGRVYMNETQHTANWLSVGLHALITGDSRFNAFGLYSTIEIRAGAMYQKRTVTSPLTHFGLGSYPHADVLRVIWPNGSYQNLEYRASDRLRLAANQVVIEEQSLKGSCPYLYAWNGERFEFVTDVLWRSALGMSIMSGVLGHHGTADDYFKISGEQFVPREGEYVLQFTEELWETAYFDYCRLFVVDHPAETDIYVDEKCLTPPYPPFEIFKVREARPIRAATDDRGRDVTDALCEQDGRYVTGFASTRYQGIAEPHDLILDLGEFNGADEVRLFLQGWLWPTDASTNVAVSQNPSLTVQPPRFSVIGTDGQWQLLDLVGGFPSGKNKTLVYNLTGRLPTSDHRLRLHTNFMIYWDRAFVTIGPQEFDSHQTELTVASADLHTRGFSHEFPRQPNGPTIPEYDALDPGRSWRDLEGDYTRFGDVTELLLAVDDFYAIVGAGDEVTLRFDASRLPELPSGWRRDFVIHTDGWLKDGDLNSATGKTVTPLPFHGMTEFPYPDSLVPRSPGIRDRRQRYQTRRRDQHEFRNRLRDGN